MVFIDDDKVVLSKDSYNHIWKQAHHYQKERIQPIRVGCQNMGIDLEYVWNHGEDRSDVSVKWRITTKHVTEEVEQTRVDSEVGEANVEGNVDGDGEDDGCNHGNTPGSRLEQQL